MPTEEDFQTVGNTVCTSIETASVEGKNSTKLKEKKKARKVAVVLKVFIHQNWHGSRPQIICRGFVYKKQQMKFGKIQIQGPTTFKPLPSRKIIVIKRNPNLMTKMDGETVVSVQNSVAKTASVERERERTQGEGTAIANKRLKVEELDESLLKRSGKMKPFRPEWLKMDIFKDWLAPDPDNICKARCVACNTVLNAGKSELEKHAVGAKHTNNLDVLKQSLVMQQMYNSANTADEEDADYDDDDDDEDYDEYLSENAGGDATNVGNGAQQQLFGGFTMQKKLDAFARIADSIDNLTSIVSSGFDRLAESNYTLAKTLSELMKK